MKHRRRQKPQKRARKRPAKINHQSRLMPARLFRIYPDPECYPHAIVEVRLCRNNRRMCESIRQQGQHLGPYDSQSSGVVKSGFGRSSRRYAYALSGLRHGRVVALMWLVVRDLRLRPSEISSHECAHAAMAWARWRGTNLGHMPGEEIMCYALGRMVAQVNRICYAAKAFE